MDIDNIATEFIEVNRRRKELEKRKSISRGSWWSIFSPQNTVIGHR